MNGKSNGLLQLNKEKRGGLLFSLLICLNCIISFVGQAIFGAIFGEESFAFSVFRFALPVISVVMVLFVNGFSTKTKSFDFSKGENLVCNTFLATCIGIGAFCSFGFVNELIAEGLKGLGLKVASSELAINGVGEYVFLVIFAAVLPAVTEESFFRGVLIKSFSEAGKVFAVLFSACLFSVYHGSATQLVYQFVCGVCFGLIYVNSKSVLPSMFAHFLNNFAVISFEYFGIIVPYRNIVFILFGIAVLIICIIVTVFALKRKNENTDAVPNVKTGKKSHVVLYATFGILICLISVISGLFV